MRTTVAVLLLVRFVDESTGFLAPASVEDFRADLSMSYSTAAAMFVSYGVGGVIGNLAVAATDRRSRKPVTLGGTVVLAAALVLIGVADSAWLVLVGTGLVAVGATGMVHGGEIAITNALASANADHELERVLARGNLLAVAGDIAGPLALAVLRAAGVGWRPVFVGAAVVALAYAVGIAGVDFPEPVAAVDDPDEPALPIRRQRVVWFLGVAAFVAMPLDEAYLATVLAFAETVVGWSDARAALLGVGFVAGGIIAFSALAGAASRVPLPRLMTTTGVTLSGVMFVATVAPGWALVPIGVIHSASLGLLWIGMQAAVLRANPGREGRTKLIVEGLEAAALVAVWAIGVAADRAGLGAAMAIYAALPLVLPVAGRGLGTGFRARGSSRSRR